MPGLETLSDETIFNNPLIGAPYVTLVCGENEETPIPVGLSVVGNFDETIVQVPGIGDTLIRKATRHVNRMAFIPVDEKVDKMVDAMVSEKLSKTKKSLPRKRNG